jgi:MbtH protein
VNDSEDLHQEPQEIFTVVINHEEQYSIWPVNKQVPEKWRDAGMSGSKQDCLAYVRRVWTDMRPLSVRNLDRSRDGDR